MDIAAVQKRLADAGMTYREQELCENSHIIDVYRDGQLWFYTWRADRMRLWGAVAERLDDADFAR